MRFRPLLALVLLALAGTFALIGDAPAGKPQPGTSVSLNFTGCHATATLTWTDTRITGASAILYDLDTQGHTTLVSHSLKGRDGTDTFAWDLASDGAPHTLQVQVALFAGNKQLPGIRGTAYGVTCRP